MNHIKYFNLYENLTEEPQVGDYAICDINVDFYLGTKREKNTLLHFIQHNIGIIYSVEHEFVRVKFKNIPFNIINMFNGDRRGGNFSLDFGLEDITYSKDLNKLKEILQMKLDINKFNI